MPTFVEKLVPICLAEYTRFGNGTRTEGQAPQFNYVGEYWTSIGLGYTGKTKIKDSKGVPRNPPWSSAFISYCVKNAGGANRFKYDQAHCRYVTAAMRVAETGQGNHGYIARRPSAYAPKVGDIVVQGREYAKNFTYDTAKGHSVGDSFYPSHGDIVVKVNEKSIETIGGNVGDTVGRKVLRINERGRLAAGTWIAVLECTL